MSELESTAKPILIPLFDSRRQVVDLSSDERFFVARWATKTAYVLNSASNFGQHVPLEHYLFLKDNKNKLPNKVIVFGQQHHGERNFYWCQGAIWQAESVDLAEFETLAKTTYKISLQLAKLILLVAWWPHNGWRYTLWRGIHVPLWPQRGPVAFYSADGFAWHDSVAAVSAFHTGLWLQKETPPVHGAV